MATLWSPSPLRAFALAGLGSPGAEQSVGCPGVNRPSRLRNFFLIERAGVHGGACVYVYVCWRVMS